MKITLAKALKLKNRLIGKLQVYISQIQKENCIIEGNTRQFNLIETLMKINSIYEHLKTLKCKIAEKNIAINQYIFSIVDSKQMICFWNSLNTKSGIEYVYDKEVKYASYFISVKAQECVSQLENEIDTLQEKIDAYNATTHIEIDYDIEELLQ
jgi:hypothetical protein